MSKAKTAAIYMRQIKVKYSGTDNYFLTGDGLKEMKILVRAFVKCMSHEEVIDILKDYGLYLEN